ncbi:MAG: hypothetical protein ACLSHG_05645 [Oscillospiraceae bacterium]
MSKRAGRDGVLGQPADQLHGRGGHGGRSAHHRRGAGGGLRRVGQGRGSRAHARPPSADALEDRETPKLKRRLIWSLGFLLVLMYFSMGHMMWGWPLPPFY